MRERATLARLILREMQYAKLNTLLCLSIVVVATGLLVAMVAVSRASVDATRVLMKQMGFNLLITPQGVDPARYQALDFQEADMPEDYVAKLADSTALAQHFVGKYQKTVPIENCTVVLTGVLAEVGKRGTDKKPMPTAVDVPRGSVFIGSAAAIALKKQPGDTLTIFGRPFEVAKVLEEIGVIPEDIRVYAHLHDVQELLGRPGRINAIDALSCYCPVPVKDVTAALEQSIHVVLPEVNVRPCHSILVSRERQRALVYRLGFATLAIVLVGSGVAIWGLTHQNVRNRRYEIGVLRALGVPDGRIVALFAGKILAYSVAGALLGPMLGRLAADWLNVTEGSLSTPYGVVTAVVVATPLAAVLFGMPSVISGLLRDPTDVLGDRGA